ncbi:MAG: sulfite reductase [Candidatus Microthrix sp.]|nr:sulfite reductase [Candidatus Microthrix sp.]MBK6438089.1 sulfite reductase [Candidatus Microthrix sp.]
MSAEEIKVASDYLRGGLAADLEAGGDAFAGDSPMLLKFHGIYQQDDRDVRRQRTQAKQPLAHGCMVRASVPGGVISAEGWAALDALADIGDGTLRLTTRQGVQYHLVPKGNLVDLVSEINAAGLTTLGACGDVVRNVMACPLPDPARAAVLAPTVAALVGRFRARTAAYWELFVNGDRAASATSAPRPGDVGPGEDPDRPVEPIYGEAYLPRKFKIGLAWPGDDCVDIHSHDVGLVPTLTGGTNGALTGFTVLAGGGMGMSHARPDDTYPMVAQPLAWVPPEQVVDLVAAVVDTQRVYGNREDRSRARLKYLLEERGIDWLRTQVEERLGAALAPPDELLPWTTHAHLGWHDADGRPEPHLDAGVDPLAAPADGAVPVLLTPTRAAADAAGTLAVPIPSGRLDEARRRTINGVVAEGLVSELRVTPRQDLLLCGVRDRSRVTELLRAGDLPLAADQAPVRNLAIACPALPTCGQALGESERVLPDLVASLEKLLADTGNAGLPLRLNMTGCPNGCARPYSAELGVVGRSKRTYDVYVGGASGRLASLLRPDVLLADIVDVLRPVLERFADLADPDTNFGDWADAVGVEAMQPWLPEAKSRRRKVAS